MPLLRSSVTGGHTCRTAKESNSSSKPCRAHLLSRRIVRWDHVLEDSGLCALALARALKVFTGVAMLPTHPCVKMDELRVSGCSRVPRFLEGLPRPQNIGSVIVPENSSRVISRPGFLLVLWCSQPQVKIASAFLFLG